MNTLDLFKRSRPAVTALALLLAAVTAGCGGSSSAGGTGTGTGTGGTGTGTGTTGTNPPGWRSVNPLPAPSQKKWTFLVFLNATNDLEPYSALNMNQMEEVGSTDQVNIVVQIKRFGNRYDRSFVDWTDTSTRRFYVNKDNDAARIQSPVIEQNDGLDMGKAESLRDFVRWGVENFPAERYCLVLWNHGAGWRSAKAGRVAGRGVSYDDQTGSHIDTVELPGAVDLGGGRKWDLLAFDASLMQMAEVAYEIRDKARYIAGSEESPPGEGYPYDAFLARLAQNPNMDGREFGVHITQDTLTAYGQNSDITHSLLDASRVGAIAPAVNSLGNALLAAKNAHGTGIAQARDLAESYAYPQNRDLIDFTRLLTSAPAGGSTPRVDDAGVRAAVEQVQSAVRDALVVSVNGSQHPRSNGLSIFLPSPSSYQYIDDLQVNGFGQRYGELAFSKAAPNWQLFLVQGPA